MVLVSKCLGVRCKFVQLNLVSKYRVCSERGALCASESKHHCG